MNNVLGVVERADGLVVRRVHDGHCSKTHCLHRRVQTEKKAMVKVIEEDKRIANVVRCLVLLQQNTEEMVACML